MLPDNQYIDYSKLTDEQLVIRFQNEDKKAFYEIMNRYKDKIVNFIFQYIGNMEDAEEIAQDSFMKFHKYKHSFKEIGKFSTWFYTIAINNATDHAKKINRHKSFSIDELNENEIENLNLYCDPQDDDDEAEVKQEYLKEAIDKLNKAFKKVILLRYHEGYEYEEISEILKIPIGTVKSRINRGREKVKEMLNPPLSKTCPYRRGGIKGALDDPKN